MDFLTKFGFPSATLAFVLWRLAGRIDDIADAVGAKAKAAWPWGKKRHD